MWQVSHKSITPLVQAGIFHHLQENTEIISLKNRPDSQAVLSGIA